MAGPGPLGSSARTQTTATQDADTDTAVRMTERPRRGTADPASTAGDRVEQYPPTEGHVTARLTPKSLERDWSKLKERFQDALDQVPPDTASAEKAFADAIALLGRGMDAGAIDKQSAYFNLEFLANQVQQSISSAMDRGAREAIMKGRPPNDIRELMTDETRVGLQALAHQALSALQGHAPGWSNVMPGTLEGRARIQQLLQSDIKNLDL